MERRALLAAATAIACGLPVPGAGRAVAALTGGPGSVHVLAPGVVIPGLRSLALPFHEQTGLQILLEDGTVQKVRARIDGGQPVDVIALPNTAMDEIEGAGRFSPGTRISLGRVGFGVAVRAGAPRPDISTLARFQSALRAAKSVACSDPATGTLGGAMIVHLLRQPAYAGVNLKLVPFAPAAVAEGNAEIGLQSLSELLDVKGIEMIGYFPPEISDHMEIDMAISASSRMRPQAEAFLRYITTLHAATIWRWNGVVPAFRQVARAGN